MKTTDAHNPLDTRSPLRRVKHITVIETVTVIGSGQADDPIRELVQYWREDGECLAEHDPMVHYPRRGTGR